MQHKPSHQAVVHARAHVTLAICGWLLPLTSHHSASCQYAAAATALLTRPSCAHARTHHAAHKDLDGSRVGVELHLALAGGVR
jgi:drug/metabolite transporter superfamily protein YnfA